jgi:aldehyde:ferredoxin oxidoreductase
MSEHLAGGYNGRTLRVNLSNGDVRIEEITENFCRKYIGGIGFIAYYLLNEIKPSTDAMSPANKLIFAVGPVTGIPLPGSGHHCVGAKSPLTGGIAKSEVGEFWGTELKRAGFDVLIIEGKAAEPVYLLVNDNNISIKDASHLWGQNTKETEEVIRAELGDDKVRIASIGPGGENQVKFACIMHGLYSAAGRCGLGAVMGSKNLKAVAVRGSRSPAIFNPDGVKVLRGWLKDNWKLVENLSRYGTGAGMELFAKVGNLPVRNFRDNSFPQVNRISSRTLKEAIGIGMEGCFGCPIRCKKKVEVKEPFLVDSSYGGPEYETLGSLGSNCGIDDLKAIAKGNELCNAYSIDTISTGGVIALAMECFEKGLLTKKDTDGVDLRFGNADAMIKMIELIAHRKGIGNLLAEGPARAAEQIGGEAKSFAMHVKNQGLPMHEPRLNKALALGYMVNPHGADHGTNMIDIVLSGFSNEPVTVKDATPLGMPSAPFNSIGPRKVALFRTVQIKMILCDSLVLCTLAPYNSYSYQQLAELTSSVTGWDTTVTEQMRTAERTLTMCQLFNVRQGLNDTDARLPERFFRPATDGPLSTTALDHRMMEDAKKYYYSLMNWDSNGVPTSEKLEELGITPE